MLKWFAYIWFLSGCCLLCSLPQTAKAQHADSTDADTTVRKSRIHDIFNQAMESIKRNPNDTIDIAAQLLAKSEDAYKKYEGRYIRHVIINQMGFEKKLADTTRYLVTVGTRIYNRLHVNTRDWVIRNNIFVKEHSRVNAYEIADNERYLRTLDFIQDARILLKPVPGHRDSVDLIVVTKDLFTITGDLDASGFNRIRARGADGNFLGMGQRVQLTLLYDQSRQPRFGYELLYSKNNFAGSFVHVTMAYSQIGTGRNEGREEEHAWYVRLYRPLVSPYSHLAGGLELSKNRSVNSYNKPDTTFYNYGYRTLDGWIGYNIGADYGNRDRKFVALRYLSNTFDRLPLQIQERFDPVYNSKQALLASVTFFRQDFFKTNYIYGFGTTEDLPYGYNIVVTGGWYKQINLQRPYFGLDVNRYIASGAGEFYQFFARTGGFINKKSIQDGSLLIGGSVFSRLMPVSNFKMREYFRLSYTQLFNRLTYQPLYIDNQLGLKGFGTDSINGNFRINAYTETFVFTNCKLLGFRFAPFVSLNAMLMKPEAQSFRQSDIFTGVGGGVRTRNENLTLGTIELRMLYFPRTAYGVHGFQIALNSNLSFRYNSNYVNAPDILRLNTDDYLY